MKIFFSGIERGGSGCAMQAAILSSRNTFPLLFSVEKTGGLTSRLGILGLLYQTRRASSICLPKKFSGLVFFCLFYGRKAGRDFFWLLARRHAPPAPSPRARCPADDSSSPALARSAELLVVSNAEKLGRPSGAQIAAPWGPE